LTFLLVTIVCSLGLELSCTCNFIILHVILQFILLFCKCNFNIYYYKLLLLLLLLLCWFCCCSLLLCWFCCFVGWLLKTYELLILLLCWLIYKVTPSILIKIMFISLCWLTWFCKLVLFWWVFLFGFVLSFCKMYSLFCFGWSWLAFCIHSNHVILVFIVLLLL